MRDTLTIALLLALFLLLFAFGILLAPRQAHGEQIELSDTINLSEAYYKDLLPDKTDLDLLARAVQRAEWGDFKPPYFNFGAVMTWKGGRRVLVRYTSPGEALKAWKAMYRRQYNRFPTLKDAMRYVGDGEEAARIWLNNIVIHYGKR